MPQVCKTEFSEGSEAENIDMEKRNLNLHAPLMSARRYASPRNSSENPNGDVVEKHTNMKQQSCKSNVSARRSEMMKPNGIPFHWEQSPGRPKDDFGCQEECAPRLPPARSLDAFRRHRSGEVPRLTPAGKMHKFNSGEALNDHNIYRPQIEAFSFGDHAMIVKKLNESLNCAEGNGSESGDSYSDALDVLSSLESAALPNNVNPVMPSELYSVGTKTRDIMMKRFLKEAKAAVVETKDPVKKSVSRAVVPFPNASNSLPHDNQYADDGESEVEIPTKKSGRFPWGFLPRLCVKNNFCLMNPFPGLKSKKRETSVPKAADARKFTRKAASGPLDRSGSPVPVVQKKKFHSGLLTRDLPMVDSKLNSDVDLHRNSHDSFKSGLSQLRRYRSGNLSPHRSVSPRSPFYEGVGSIAHEVDGLNGNKLAYSRKMFNALHDVSRSHVNARGSVAAKEAVEKTVYIVASSYEKNEPISGGNLKGGQVCGRIEDGKTRYKPMVVTKDWKPVQDSSKEAVKKPLALAPPLPDSPSDSWLWMTASRKSLSPRLPSTKQIQTCGILDSQRETIVSKERKTYSQELVAHSN